MIDRKKLAKWLIEANGSCDIGFYQSMASDLIKAIEDGELEPTPEVPCRHQFFSWSWGRLKMSGQCWSRRCKFCGYQEITYRNPIKE